MYICQFSLKSFTTFVRVHVRLGGGVKKKGYLNFASQKNVFEAIRRCSFRICNYTWYCIPTTFAPLRDNNWVSGVSVCCVWPLIYELSCPCVADCTVGSVFAGIIVGILLTLLVLHGKWEPIKIFMLVIHISSNFLILILYFGWYKSRCFMITLVHEYLNVWFFFSLKKMRSFKKTRAVSNQSYEADFYIDPVRLLYSKKS